MPTCCHLTENDPAQPCGAPAAWVIQYGEGPEDYTESCTAHVGPLLSDAPVHTVYPISPDPTILRT